MNSFNIDSNPNSNISKKIKQITDEIESLPTLPGVVSQIIELTSDPKTSFKDLSRIISEDQTLTARILKLVNSAYYGFPRRISTITHALIILGFNEIKNITFATSILRTFGESDNLGDFNREEFWKHSLGCALASKMLAKTLRYRISGQAFTAGLIHDIGKIILDQYLHKSFAQIIEKVQSENISIREAEKDVLGITHAEIGAWLAKKWNLPAEIEEAIKFHHLPDKAIINPQLTAIVHLSDILVRMESIGWGGDDKIPSVNPLVWNSLKPLKPDINESYIQYFTSIFETEIGKVCSLFDIL
ncbi:HDOD domain-containing protein [Candidatus Aerophobetes bacterium]|nr:HDOD domain-containing protein [Candidatus Aerophobetes bacterium]